MTRHFPAITEPARFGELLRAIDHYAALVGRFAACFEIAEAAPAPPPLVLERVG